MLLEQLRFFEWLNEPSGVFLIDNGMKVTSDPETSFWQNKRSKISRDSGHFFFTEKTGFFSITIKWKTNAKPAKCETGLMLRLDRENWIKCYSSYDNNGKNKIYTSLTNLGFSDLTEVETKNNQDNLWFRATKSEKDIEISYSEDGNIFTTLRKFNFINDCEKLKTGAYICSPNNVYFEAILTDIENL